MSEITREQAIDILIDAEDGLRELVETLAYVAGEIGWHDVGHETARASGAVGDRIARWINDLQEIENKAQAADKAAERMIDGWQEEFDALHPEEA